MPKGRYDKAFNSLLRLRRAPLQAARDFYFTRSYRYVTYFLSQAAAYSPTHFARDRTLHLRSTPRKASSRLHAAILQLTLPPRPSGLSHTHVHATAPRDQRRRLLFLHDLYPTCIRLPSSKPCWPPSASASSTSSLPSPHSTQSTFPDDEGYY